VDLLELPIFATSITHSLSGRLVPCDEQGQRPAAVGLEQQIGVNSVVGRIKQRIASDRSLRRKVEAIRRRLA